MSLNSFFFTNYNEFLCQTKRFLCGSAAHLEGGGQFEVHFGGGGGLPLKIYFLFCLTPSAEGRAAPSLTEWKKKKRFSLALLCCRLKHICCALAPPPCDARPPTNPINYADSSFTSISFTAPTAAGSSRVPFSLCARLFYATTRICNLICSSLFVSDVPAHSSERNGCCGLRVRATCCGEPPEKSESNMEICLFLMHKLMF